MSEGLTAYELWVALSLHFNPGSSYSFFKYGGKTRASSESYAKKSPRERWPFAKIEKKYAARAKDYFVANLATTSPPKWVGQCTHANLAEWQGYREAIDYKMSSQISALDGDALLISKEGSYPEIVRAYLRGEAHLEILADLCANWPRVLQYWNSEISDPILWPKIAHLIEAYSPFRVPGSRAGALIRKRTVDLTE